MSVTDWQPVWIMASFNSSCNISSTFSTPFCPPAASPHKTALPRNTALAPRAKALRISVPLRTPPSKKTSTFLPWHAWMTSSRTSIVAGVVSSWRAPWLETKIASAPCYKAMRASSAHMIPLATTGRPLSRLISGMTSQPIFMSLWFLTYSARPESLPEDLISAFYPWVVLYLL